MSEITRYLVGIEWLKILERLQAHAEALVQVSETIHEREDKGRAVLALISAWFVGHQAGEMRVKRHSTE
jgi:hypothetical protein